MGLMDRDYWRDRYNKRTRGSKDPMSAVYSPKLFRGGSTSASTGGSGRWGSWFFQLVVWVVLLGSLFMGFKYFEQRSYVALLEKQMAGQHKLIQQQKRELEVLRRQVAPRPNVDFFK